MLFSGGEQQQDGLNQILYRKRETSASSSHHPPSPSTTTSSSSCSSSHGSPDRRPTNPHTTLLSPSRSQAAVRAREFAADIFRRAQAGTDGDGERQRKDGESSREVKISRTSATDSERRRAEERREDTEGPSTSHGKESASSSSSSTEPEDSVSCSTVMSPASTSSSCSLSPHAASTSEPGYVNYTRLRYRLQQPGTTEQDTGKTHSRKRSNSQNY